MSAENTQNKIVNVHGVQFDISSILNDVTASIQNNIQKSLDGALKDYELYKSTHDAILQIPFVRDLYIQNQELISQLDQPIQLKIDEILPPTSPPVMHSYVQMFDSNHNDPNKKNKKLSEEDESTSTIQSECSSESDSEEAEESESSEEEVEESESESEQEEAEEEEQEQEVEQEEEVEEEEQEQEEAEQEQEEAEQEQEEAEEEEEEQEQEEAEQEEEQEEAEEEEQEQEEAEEEEQEEEEVEEEQEQEEAEEEEVYEIMIKNVTYFTTNENDGDIYSCVDGDVGEVVGKFKNKKPVFARRK
jgi:DNA polymerase III gamma/tau subunit